MDLQLYTWLPQTRVLGPWLRFALWVQGCPFRCPGCMTPAALPFDGGTAWPVAELTQRILDTPDIEGITVSGGEPFAQAAALVKLIETVQARRDLGVVVYTGYTLPKLQKSAQQDSARRALLACTDLLIDGPYLAAQDDGLSLRGSANQQAHALTARYATAAAQDYGRSQRAVEVHWQGAEVMLAGIAGEEVLGWWRGVNEYHSDREPIHE